MSYTSIRDMFDGGGAGQSGDKFEGPANITKALNGLGVKPASPASNDNSDDKPSTSYSSSGENGSNDTRKDAGAYSQSADKPTSQRTDNGGTPMEQMNATNRAKAEAQAAAKTQAPAAPKVDPTDVAALAEAAYKAGIDPKSVFDNPEAFLNGASLASQVPNMTGAGNKTIIGSNKYNGDVDGANVTAQTATATGVNTVDPKDAATYTADQVAGKVATDGQAVAAQGEVSDEAIMEAEQIDTVGAATGTNADGTDNELGKALNSWASQDIAKIIDTSTVSGKLLAQQLGEGNYTDAKATVAGQMEILSAQFVDSQGNPKIPSWAAGTARNVSKIAAFKGMTGTAATAAMSQAIMEASLPMAQQDAAFFQTVTMTNLNNKQQATIQKASVLANLELANLDARTQAAVTNAQAFLQMDLANLDNEQQTEIVNTQARVQALLEDSKATNAARLFTAQSQNDFTQFYDQLNTQIEQYTATQTNEMARFNVDQVNSTSQFNSQLETNREQFYKEMQYNVDVANAKWRQTIETTETQMAFQAAQQDVQNLFGLSSEAMSQMWDREDAALNYAWQTSESVLDRQLEQYLADKRLELDTRKQSADEDAAFGEGLFEVVKWGFGGIF